MELTLFGEHNLAMQISQEFTAFSVTFMRSHMTLLEYRIIKSSLDVHNFSTI